MTGRFFTTLMVGIQMGLAATMAFAAPGDNVSVVRGQVTKVDATAKTITVNDRRTQSDTTFSVNDSTKYLVSVPGALTDLKVGDKVRVMGPLDGTTIDARMIQVVPEIRANPGGNGPGGMRRGVEGTIATTTPSLTVTTADNTTDTVNTTPQTRVMTPKDGSLSDVEVGKGVTAVVDGSVTPAVAKRVEVMPPFRGRGPGGPGAPGGPGSCWARCSLPFPSIVLALLPPRGGPAAI